MRGNQSVEGTGGAHPRSRSASIPNVKWVCRCCAQLLVLMYALDAQGDAVVSCQCGSRHVPRGGVPCRHFPHWLVSPHAQLQPGPAAFQVVCAGQCCHTAKLFYDHKQKVSGWGLLRPSQWGLGLMSDVKSCCAMFWQHVQRGVPPQRVKSWHVSDGSCVAGEATATADPRHSNRGGGHQAAGPPVRRFQCAAGKG